MKKDSPIHSLSPKIQEAFSKAESTFGKVANRYDSASQDIKLTEKLLGEKDVKSTFVFNFCRIEDMYEEGYPNNKGWDPEEDGYQTLDWRKDPTSNRYRLMVSNYRIKMDRYLDPNAPNGFVEEGEVCLNNMKPLIECPIEDRLYYHPRLSQFVTTFAGAIQEHLIEAGSQTLATWYEMQAKYEDDEKSGEKRVVGRIPAFSHNLRNKELVLSNEADPKDDS
jgi:hypothetical protein